MFTLRRQDGSGLIILIGVVAALAVMATILVGLTANVGFNAAKQRAKDKSFGVAEAGMDGMMYVLSNNWPDASAKAPDATPTPGGTPAWTVQANLLRTQGTYSSMAEFPNPASGHGAFLSAVAYDNSDTDHNGTINASDAHWDANGDNLMYVQAQGSTGSQSTRVLTLVQRTFVPTTFPRGVALFTGANLATNGGGNKIQVEDSGGQTVVADITNPTGLRLGDLGPGVTAVTPSSLPPVPPIGSLWPPSLTQQLIDLAQSLGRYHDVAGGATMPTDFSGICVIKVADGTIIKLANGNTQINSPANPGILVILGGPNVVVNAGGGTVDYYGVFYTEGQVGNSGTPAIHGMLVSTSTVTIQGTANVYYNDSYIMKLANKWTLAVQQFPNTWREIQPVYP
jgi:hypothetical protein